MFQSKTYISMKRIVLVILLLSFNISNLKAQEMITFPDERYYWDRDTSKYDTDSSGFFWFDTRNYSVNDNVYLTEKELRRPALLKEVIFPTTTETRVYGIAGSTIGCNNPYGCYFYLCKKINGEYVILDSARWDHTTNYKYVDYYSNSTSLNNPIDIGWYASIVRDGGVPMLDTIEGAVPVFEAFFDYPFSMNDTFYIGMNSNGVLRKEYSTDTTTLWPNNSLRKHYSLWWMRVNEYVNNLYDWNWIHAPHGEVYRYWLPINALGGLHPIISPPTCPTIIETKVDSLTYCSAHIGWRQTYVSTYCRIEYGVEGFVRGTGTTIDNITTTDVILNNLLPNTGYDVYLQSYCAASDTVSGWRKISFVTLDTMCPALENLRMLYVRDVRAKIRWDNPSPEVSHCELEWGESGFEQGQGYYVRYVYDTSYSFLSLAAGTTYDVYIRTYCPRSNVYGDWQKLTFTTEGNSIDEAENQLPISVNPNPTTGMVEVTLPQGYENQTVEVYDVQGKLLQSQRLQNGKATFNLSEYPNGVYVIKVGNANCRVVKSK